MTIQLFMMPVSTPVRAVLMTAKALDIKLELKQIDLWKGEQKTPEYLKMNPQHTVPTINDNGIIIWDSHAINAYLVSKYAKSDSLYPNDPVKRAIVDQRLHFDSEVLSIKMRQILRPIFISNKTTIEQAEIDSLTEAYEFLEKFLEGRKWIAGDSVTIADYSIYNTIATTNLLVPINPNKFPKLSAWYKNVDSLPESEAIKEGLNIVMKIVKEKLGK